MLLQILTLPRRGYTTQIKADPTDTDTDWKGVGPSQLTAFPFAVARSGPTDSECIWQLNLTVYCIQLLQTC